MQAEEGVEEFVVEDTDWRADTEGLPGEEVSLELLLRVGCCRKRCTAQLGMLATSLQGAGVAAAAIADVLLPELLCGLIQHACGEADPRFCHMKPKYGCAWWGRVALRCSGLSLLLCRLWLMWALLACPMRAKAPFWQL